MNYQLWIVAAGLAVAMLGGGCESRYAWQGDPGGRVLAAYSGRTLSTELPDNVRVPAIIAAGESALLNRGYSIVTRDATIDKGRVVGRPSDGGLAGYVGMDRVIISSKQSARGTRVWVTAEPLGDETLSRAVLDAILVRLGM